MAIYTIQHYCELFQNHSHSGPPNYGPKKTFGVTPPPLPQILLSLLGFIMNSIFYAWIFFTEISIHKKKDFFFGRRICFKERASHIFPICQFVISLMIFHDIW